MFQIHFQHIIYYQHIKLFIKYLKVSIIFMFDLSGSSIFSIGFSKTLYNFFFIKFLKNTQICDGYNVFKKKLIAKDTELKIV